MNNQTPLETIIEYLKPRMPDYRPLQVYLSIRNYAVQKKQEGKEVNQKVYDWLSRYSNHFRELYDKAKGIN